MKKIVKNFREFIKMNEKVSSLYEGEGQFDYTIKWTETPTITMDEIKDLYSQVTKTREFTLNRGNESCSFVVGYNRESGKSSDQPVISYTVYLDLRLGDSAMAAHKTENTCCFFPIIKEIALLKSSDQDTIEEVLDNLVHNSETVEQLVEILNYYSK